MRFEQAERIALNMTLRFDGGLENKGVFVHSNEPISVMGNNQLRGWSGDVFLFNALWDISTEFLVVSREPVYDNAVFSVIAAYDGTTVNIWRPSTSGYIHWQILHLNRLETFTFKEETDPTGYKIISNKTVSVLSGSQTDVVGSGTSGDHMCVSLPPTTYIDQTDYYIIPITIRNNPGAYHIRILAIYNFTVVSDLKNADNQIATLSEGQYHESGPVASGTFVTALRCSKPCIVMQYNMDASYDGTPNIDGFQMWIPSLHHRVNYINFITPHNEYDTAMQNTLVILTWSAVTTEILVDGVSLNNWVEFWPGSEISYAVTSVIDGEHAIVYRGDPQYGFLAWLYGNNAGHDDAYGTLLGVRTGKATCKYSSVVKNFDIVICKFLVRPIPNGFHCNLFAYKLQ